MEKGLVAGEEKFVAGEDGWVAGEEGWVAVEDGWVGTERMGCNGRNFEEKIRNFNPRSTQGFSEKIVSPFGPADWPALGKIYTNVLLY